MVRCLIGVLAVALVGCQPAFVHGRPNEDSPYFEVPAGSKFVLRTEILMPPRTDRLYFQDGKLPAWYNVNKYRPYCVLQVKSAHDHAKVIEPDEFVVTKVSTAHFFQLIEAPTQSGSARLATATDAALVTNDRESKSGDDYEIFGSVMQLHSTRQPAVTKITCADWGLPQAGTYITVRKIRQALGSYFQLDIGPT
jgi:hypothetical protein